MNRSFKALAALAVAYPKPAIAGSLMLLGVGGGAVAIAILTPPTITPLVSTNFNPSQVGGTTSNTLRPNGGAAGPFQQPSIPSTTNALASWTVLWEMQTDPTLGFASGQENLFSAATVFNNGVPGAPFLVYQRSVAGIPGSLWWNNPSFTTNAATTVTGANAGYNTGIYPFTATCTGSCVRPMSGFWQPGNAATSVVQVKDPGFGYSVAPTINAATVPNAGAQQPGITATCASGGLGMLVTTSVPVSPGLTPGQQYNLSGFTTSSSATTAGSFVVGVAYTITSVGSTSFTAIGAASNTVGVVFVATGVGTGTGTATITIDTTLIPTSVTGSGPYSVVGTAAGSCPTISSTGNFGSGTGATFNVPAFSTTAPFGTGGTGIVTRNNQHACWAMGEYGADNPLFPGAAFITAVDDKGNALQGAPAEPLWLNQGSTNFQGSTAANVLTVSAMNSYTMTGAPTFTGGQISFSLTSSPGFVPGSEFTVSGVTSSGASLNQTYVAVSPTVSTGTAITGVPLSGPGGSPQAIASPGTISGTGSIVGVIIPDMTILGASTTTVIMPYGTSSATGTGGAGTYALSASPTAISAGNIFAWSSAYYTAAVNGAVPSGATLTARATGTIGEIVSTIGNTTSSLALHAGFGGSLGNFAMVYGSFPQNANGTPATTGANSLASLCTKATDIQAFASTNGLTVKSLYRLNDPGIWGDSGDATITGYITNPGGAAATLNVVSTTYGSLALATGTLTAKLTGVGLPVASPVTIPLTTSAGSTYAITPNTTAALGSIGSPVTFAVGAFAPATPIFATGSIAPNNFKGYIDSSNLLHVTSLDNGSQAGLATFTGSLSTGFTGSIAPGTGSNGAPIGQGLLTITVPASGSSQPAVVGVGTVIAAAPGNTALTAGTVVTGIVTGVSGLAGNYIVNNSQTVASETMRGTCATPAPGCLPGYPTALDVSSVTGTIAVGQYVTDGNNSITGTPLLILGGTAPAWTVLPNTYPSISADATMVSSYTTLIPGEYVASSGMLFPVKVTGGWTACGITGAVNGGLGCYTLSNTSNGTVASSGSPAAFTGTTATDGGAIAPGPALTIRDQGPGVTFPATRGAATGTITLSGAYDVPTLGGTPSGIQVLVSNSANGPPLAGCTPCNWGALTGTISGGKWSGTLAGIPSGGPYFVSVRAANGTAYATLPNYVKVGSIDTVWGQGQAGGVAIAGGISGFTSFTSGVPGLIRPHSAFNPNTTVLTGPDLSPGYPVGASTNIAGDRFSVSLVSGVPLSEGALIFDQLLSQGSGYPTTLMDASRDGVGIMPSTLGNTVQTQTVAVADGTKLAWCSATTYCANAGSGAQLTFNAAALSGASFLGTIGSGGTTLTVGTWTSGALEPGMVLSVGLGVTGFTGNPTLVNCLTNCTGINGATSTWALSAAPCVSACTAVAMFADPGSPGAAPWKYFNAQIGGFISGFGIDFGFGGFGAVAIKPGTFSLVDTTAGTTLCADTTAFAYNLTGGNCAGSNIDTANTFVNYLTGDYEVAFNSGHAPISGHVLTAQWTAIIAPTAVTPIVGRPALYDWFGDGTPTGGLVSSIYSKAPGGVSANIYAGWGGTDAGYWLNSGAVVNPGYQFGAYGYTQAVSWLFSTKFPNTIPGANGSSLFAITGQWRDENPGDMAISLGRLADGIMDALASDIATKSTFSGTISTGVLTLSGSATGPMWEGEVIDCVTPTTACPLTGQSGVYITALLSGSWGANLSTYALAGSPANVSPAAPMQNEIYWPGPGPVAFLGTLNDILDQPGNINSLSAGAQPHALNGIAGYSRSSRRWAAMLWGQDPNNSAPFSDPTLSRANDSAAGTPSPAFDYSTTYQASHAATWTGNTVTISGGLAAHARPFVVGQAFSCASCASGLVITSLSVPPTQSTATGAGEVGQTFTFTAKNAAGASIGGSGTGTVTAGCTAGSGGSNCINVDITLNNSGTFGTAAALATCGVNNFNGNAPNYTIPNGKCQDNGIGELSRSFRIGTNQFTYIGNTGGPLTPGSTYDDGIDPSGGAFTQSSAHTCNIVTATIVQCVKGPAYSAGLLTGAGKWLSYNSGTGAGTFISYGDHFTIAGRIGSLLGYVGGQSFPFSSGGTGYSSQNALAASCPVKGSGGTNPLFDITAVSGVIVNVQPSATSSSVAPAFGLAIGVSSSPPVACTLTPPTGTGFNSSGSISINVDPVEGVGGIATYNTDTNHLGTFLYDNSGFVGNPNNQFFTNGQGGYFEPGLPTRAFGVFQGAVVSG